MICYCTTNRTFPIANEMAFEELVAAVSSIPRNKWTYEMKTLTTSMHIDGPDVFELLYNKYQPFTHS